MWSDPWIKSPCSTNWAIQVVRVRASFSWPSSQNTGESLVTGLVSHGFCWGKDYALCFDLRWWHKRTKENGQICCHWISFHWNNHLENVICVFVCVCVRACVCAHARTLWTQTSIVLHSIILRQGLSLNIEIDIFQLGRQPMNSSDPLTLWFLSALRVQAHIVTLGFLYACWGSEHESLHLHSKDFYPPSHLLSLKQSYLLSSRTLFWATTSSSFIAKHFGS